MKLIRSTAVIGGFTLISRTLGLIRDVLIARFLGAGAVSDAFFTAFKLPNVFRRMFAEGAFNAAFVPLYAKRLEEGGDRAADEFAGESAAVLLVTVAALVVAFEVTMPWSLSLIGLGLDRAVDPETGISPYYLAVLYAQITMPYLIFMSMTALFSGVLNTRNFFVIAAAVPIVLNLFMIGVLALTPVLDWAQSRLGLYLSIAISSSGVVQMVLVIWGCRRAGVKTGLKRPRLTPGVKRLVILGIPGIISAGITQINLLVSHSIATLKDNAASWLTYADRLYQLPLGIIGVAMGIALLPSLSRRLQAGDEVGARTSLNRAIEISAFLTLPAAFALAVVPEFFIGGLYQRGAFTFETTTETAKALHMFAYGLPAFVLLKVLTPAFFARENTRTPMIFAGISATINVALGLYLFFSVGFQGLALATSVAAWVNVLCLVNILLKNGSFIPDTRLVTRLPRILLASVAMAVALLGMEPWFVSGLTGMFLSDLMILLSLSIAGLTVYTLAVILLRAINMDDIRDALKRRET
ncbi:MAG: murein biosynthesis integral membrane protein MurJ [Hyphomonadaceae bacterium]|nr:murein biosynthesis integral membrane protein MurJ [Hyphomonadaceae bacterium]MBC6413234.1 murein biosynthesis integral membrane protein MurJ [Hyphomonadaceae bacterium]